MFHQNRGPCSLAPPQRTLKKVEASKTRIPGAGTDKDIDRASLILFSTFIYIFIFFIIDCTLHEVNLALSIFLSSGSVFFLDKFLWGILINSQDPPVSFNLKVVSFQWGPPARVLHVVIS